jgi:poly(A) polymerase Pap1
MGCAAPGADLDLIAVIPGTPDLAELRARVTAALPDVTRLREVTGARVPGLRFRTADGLDVDLTVVGAGPLAPAEAVPRRAELGEPAAIALSAVSDADAVRDAVGADSHARFAVLAVQVKTWAKARGLDSAPFGGLPGLAWSILAARTTREAGPMPADALLHHFFATWAAWDWRTPVTLTEPATPTTFPLTILTPTAPIRSCTTQVGTGFRDLLTQELYRAWTILEAGAATPWPELLSPPPLHRRHAAWLVLTVRPDRAGDFEETLGRVRGRVRALLTALEDAGLPDAHAWPHPYEPGPPPAPTRYAIGLGHSPPPAPALAALAERWTRGLPGVELTCATGGEVLTFH